MILNRLRVKHPSHAVHFDAEPLQSRIPGGRARDVPDTQALRCRLHPVVAARKGFRYQTARGTDQEGGL